MRQHRCLVVTLDGVPIARVSAERAVVLILQGKAYMIQSQGNLVFKSQKTQVPVPAVVGLTTWYKLPGHFYGHARLTVNTLLRRDGWTCQYCGKRKQELKSKEFFTRDHVFPVSRGGEDIWVNVVLSCNKCNNAKSDRTPDEAGMTLLRTPFAPSRWQLNKKYVRDALLQDNTELTDMITDEDMELVTT